MKNLLHRMKLRFLTLKEQDVHLEYLAGYKEAMGAVTLWIRRYWVNPDYVKQLKEELVKIDITNDNLRNRVTKLTKQVNLLDNKIAQERNKAQAREEHLKNTVKNLKNLLKRYNHYDV